MWKLVIEDDEGKRTVVPLTRDDYAVGRKEGNTIRLTERNVSRDHAKLRKKNGDGKVTYVLDDLTSYNGVFVNGLRVAQTHELVHGDLIQIGDYRIVLQDDAVVEPAPLIPIHTDPKTTIPSGVMRGANLLERPNRLVMLAGPTPGVEYPLAGDRLTVGRAEDATISVNHNSVSREHCEIHALGEGRFEIVDKKSSNGVRVNGAELKRGIIEAGDVIELGDVKLKFVGAGQVFLPGVNDSQQLAAIGNRSSDSSRRSGGYGPALLFGTVLAVIVVIVLYTYRRNLQQVPAPVPEADREQATIVGAQMLCDSGDCFSAHAKLHAEIPETSPIKAGDAYRALEQRWADAAIKRADGSSHLDRKRALLQEVANATTIDADRRAQATSRLQEMDATPAPSASPSSIHSETTPVVASSPTEGAQVAPASVREHRHGQAVSGTDAPPPAATPTPKAQSALDKARDVMLNDPNQAKAILMPRVVSGRGSPEEIRLLLTICRDALNDQVCVTKCKELLNK